MGQTIAEKIIARTSGNKTVSPGDIVWARPDLVTTPEVSFPAYMRALKSAGITKLADPDRVVVVIDHEAPAQTVKGAERNKEVRVAASNLRVGHFFEAEGITHPLVIEKGLVRPGMLVTAADTHTTTLGGVGALAIPFGFELTMVLGIGKIWLKVPESIRIELTGDLKPGVTGRDVIMAATRIIGPKRADYRVFEFTGPGLEKLSVQTRMTICNMAIDSGAKSAVMPASEICLEYLRQHGVENPERIDSDDDAQYAERISIDLGALEPQVAAPPSPTEVRSVADMVQTKITHAYIGSCASGTIEDLRLAARILQHKQVHASVELLIIPSTISVYREAMREGLLDVFMQSGAQVSSPTCGPCFGGLAQLAAGDVRISTSTRNDPGRMGSTDAMIYLASAATVAASALKGCIADPRDALTQHHEVRK